MAEGVWRFGVLGPLVLEREGQSVPLPSGRQRSLLALFLMAGGVPLSRDRLIDELWGERQVASAVSALHVHLSKLRDLLGDLLVREAAGYYVRAEEIELDCWRFDALVDRARANPAEAREMLRQALGLVRGDPLCDVACEGSVAQWRRALEEKQLQALLLRVDADLGAGAAGELVAELESLVSAHPFEERLWGQLMLALYRSGRQADALDAFARARRGFATELGLEPSEQLVRLHAQMLEHDSSLLTPAGDARTEPGPIAAEEPAVDQSARAPKASSIPAAVTKLIGREPELAVLQALLADHDVRVVTLIGAGGVGKTRLALELARRIEAGYRDGAVLVRLERLTGPALGSLLAVWRGVRRRSLRVSLRTRESMRGVRHRDRAQLHAGLRAAGATAVRVCGERRDPPARARRGRRARSRARSALGRRRRAVVRCPLRGRR